MSSFAIKKSLRRIAQLAQRDGRYKVDAYLFMQQALAYAQLQRGQGRRRTARRGGEETPAAEDHLSPQELCEALRQYALELYGLMAKVVLSRWGVRSTSDFGEIVFQLIEIGEMTKSPNDLREDFDDVYDFEDAFRQQYQFTMIDER